jgi:FkbM family methyltransferase
MCSSAVVRFFAGLSPKLARQYADWYRNQTIRYPNWLGHITWEKTLRSADGATFHAAFHEAIGMNLILDGVHEPEITDRLRRVLNKGSVFIDVGANLGYYTLLASRIVGDDGLVMAFEPSPWNLSLLGKNLALNRSENVVVFSDALSDRGGIAKLSLPWYFNAGVCSLGKGPSANGAFDDGFTLTGLRTLDQVLDCLHFERPVKLIKIDVEGHEPNVVRGMERLIHASKSLEIVCELSPQSYSVPEFCNYMHSLGFSGEYWMNGAWCPISISAPPQRFCDAWFTKA